MYNLIVVALDQVRDGYNEMLERSVDSVPSPDGGVITDRDEDTAVTGPGRLPHRTNTFAVTQAHSSDAARVLNVHIPDVGLPHLVTESQQPLTRVQAEPHEPDLAVLHLQLVNYGRLVVGKFLTDPTSVQAARLPADDLILTRFREDEVAEPATTVDIVPVNVPG